MTLDALATVLVSGLVMGSVYALMASGLSLVWSTLGIFNFAHGALMTLGAYLAWTLAGSGVLGLPPWIAMLVAVALVAAVGVLLERLLIRPFYGHRAMLLVTVMTTLAATVFLSKGIQLVWGPRLKELPALAPGNVSILGTSISAQEALIVGVAPIVLGALWAFLRFSSTGRGIRAVGQNPQAAQLIGIDVPRLFAIAFALAAALAALTGILIGSVRLVTPSLGDEPLIKALIIVIFGGLGSMAGTIWAAYLIGLAEALLVFTIGIYWAPSTLFLLLILVLVLRPQGLMGKVVR
ncbi:branched-chain amino acid ABC transporter permease [Rubellimicrobium arenae]|uniref:branched-chain amino acid ABC transporter permease n=1 Tax=Rubellimicrobium arenae TaxID=2817372 RepID=UPI001B316068|nr:branched-chain amino acid ABC transporter permease [Rubellimicrobium arenae]